MDVTLQRAEPEPESLLSAELSQSGPGICLMLRLIKECVSFLMQESNILYLCGITGELTEL